MHGSPPRSTGRSMISLSSMTCAWPKPIAGTHHRPAPAGNGRLRWDSCVPAEPGGRADCRRQRAGRSPSGRWPWQRHAGPPSTLLADDLRLAFANASATSPSRRSRAWGLSHSRSGARTRPCARQCRYRGGHCGCRLRAATGPALAAGCGTRRTGRPVTNETLANLAGPAIRVRGGIATGGDGPLDFDRLRINASKLTMALDGSVRDGTTRVAGSGRHADYGAFTVEASVTGTGPTAALVFDQPFTGLENVRVAAPTRSLLPRAGRCRSVCRCSPLRPPTADAHDWAIARIRDRRDRRITLIEGGADGTLDSTAAACRAPSRWHHGAQGHDRRPHGMRRG